MGNLTYIKAVKEINIAKFCTKSSTFCTAHLPIAFSIYEQTIYVYNEIFFTVINAPTNVLSSVHAEQSTAKDGMQLFP